MSRLDPPVRGRPALLHWTVLVILTAVFVVALRAGHVPAALLFGPLLAGIVLGLRGVDIRPSPLVSAGAQAVVGCMIATGMTPALVKGLIAHAWTYLLTAAATLALTMLLGWWMTARRWLPGTTAIWGMAPGASTAMVLMSDAYGADQRLVAMMQYLRILMVAAAAVGLAQLVGTSNVHPLPIATQLPLDFGRLLITLAVAASLGLLGKVTRFPAGVFLFPMVGGATLQAMGGVQLELPVAVLAVAYAIVGWNIGLGFTPATMAYGARAMPKILGALVALLIGCGAIAAVVSAATNVDPLSAYLATSPGGIDSILIIATSTTVNLPFILGAQLVRFMLVLLVGPIVASRLSARLRQ